MARRGSNMSPAVMAIGGFTSALKSGLTIHAAQKAAAAKQDLQSRELLLREEDRRVRREETADYHNEILDLRKQQLDISRGHLGISGARSSAATKVDLQQGYRKTLEERNKRLLDKAAAARRLGLFGGKSDPTSQAMAEAAKQEIESIDMAIEGHNSLIKDYERQLGYKLKPSKQTSILNKIDNVKNTDELGILMKEEYDAGRLKKGDEIYKAMSLKMDQLKSPPPSTLEIESMNPGEESAVTSEPENVEE